MGSKPWLNPAPIYRLLETYWENDEDAPGPRCEHTLTSVAATKTHGPRLILFGGATAVEDGNGGAAGIPLAGVTNSIHSYDVLTRKWTRHFFSHRNSTVCHFDSTGKRVLSDTWALDTAQKPYA